MPVKTRKQLRQERAARRKEESPQNHYKSPKRSTKPKPKPKSTKTTKTKASSDESSPDDPINEINYGHFDANLVIPKITKKDLPNMVFKEVVKHNNTPYLICKSDKPPTHWIKNEPWTPLTYWGCVATKVTFVVQYHLGLDVGPENVWKWRLRQYI